MSTTIKKHWSLCLDTIVVQTLRSFNQNRGISVNTLGINIYNKGIYMSSVRLFDNKKQVLPITAKLFYAWKVYGNKRMFCPI